MSEGTATLEATRGESLRVDQVESAVKSAGFTPRGMTATAAGVVHARGEARVLRWGDSEVEILLRGDNAPIEDPQRVRVTGTLTVEQDEGRSSFSLVMTVDAAEPE